MRRRKIELFSRLEIAKALRDRTEAVAIEAAEVAEKQAEVSERLREQRRLNHFSELFQFGIPRKAS